MKCKSKKNVFNRERLYGWNVNKAKCLRRHNYEICFEFFVAKKTNIFFVNLFIWATFKELQF